MPDWSPKPPALTNLLDLTGLLTRLKRLEMLQKAEAVRQSIASMPVKMTTVPTLPRPSTAIPAKLQHLKVTTTRRSRF